MADTVFVNGIPERIGLQYFRRRFGQNFPTLLKEDYNDLLQAAIDDVYIAFAGVGELWSGLSLDAYFERTQLCYGLLVAWWLTDLYPRYASGVVSSGGIPLHSKQIGGVKIVFAQGDKTSGKGGTDLLAPLKSNSFGYKAYQMIKGSTATARIRTARRL